VGSLTTWLSDRLDGPAYQAPTPAASERARVLVLDNYDSFTYNLAQRLGTLGAEVDVVRNDRATVEELLARAGARDFSHLVVSPGPGRPEDAGISVPAVAALGGLVPVLGVCLGHQCIGQAYGASVVRSGRPVHGRRSLVHHDGRGVYAGLGAPFAAGRYHSLVVTDLPDDLLATAYTGDGVLMGLRHRTLPVEGVQLHPESILTDLGDVLLGSFLA
jgi:para-aminobenzoate synthetase/4-amino-4-deoxychorismate lyase